MFFGNKELIRDIPILRLQFFEVGLFGQVKVQRRDRDISLLKLFNVCSVVQKVTANRIQTRPVIGSTARIGSLFNLFRDATDAHRDEANTRRPAIFGGWKIDVPKLTGSSFRE